MGPTLEINMSTKRVKIIYNNVLSSDRDCPHGLRTGVPETTTEEALPWYPTGRYNLCEKPFML